MALLVYSKELLKRVSNEKVRELGWVLKPIDLLSAIQ
jgi:hypothetical protein